MFYIGDKLVSYLDTGNILTRVFGRVVVKLPACKALKRSNLLRCLCFVRDPRGNQTVLKSIGMFQSSLNCLDTSEVLKL